MVNRLDAKTYPKNRPEAIRGGIRQDSSGRILAPWRIKRCGAQQSLLPKAGVKGQLELRAMNFGFWNFYPYYNRNRMFTQGTSEIGDDLAYPTVLLGQRLRDLGHGVATLDMEPLEWFDKIFFIDYPTWINGRFRRLRRMRHPHVNLMASEPPMIRPSNYAEGTHALFDKVLTWKSELVAKRPEKCVQYHLPNKLREPPPAPPFAERKLAVMINRFMAFHDPRELFSERVRAIRWFEQQAPDDFDLYGSEWDKPLFSGRLAAVNLPWRLMLRRIGPLKRIKVHRFPSFRGPVASKYATLPRYRFCIAYENCAEADYMSEKLFDCFFAGCVPVYLGAPNVLEVVPKEAFVDKRNFGDYDELGRFLKSMTEKEYKSYLEAGLAFLRSPRMRPFTAEGFAENFIGKFAA